MTNELKEVKTKPTLAVVLGAGGIRSLSALPLLEHLQKQKVAFDTLITTGGGAVLAALFSCGFSADEIPKLMSEIFDPRLYAKLDYPMVMKIFGLRTKPFTSPPAPYKNTALRGCLKDIFKDRRLEDLPHSVQISATDMATGSTVVLKKGLLADCLYASNTVYPFMGPIQQEGRWLAGGVFTEAIPIMTAVKQNIDVILVMSFNDERPIEANSFYEYVNTFFIRACTNTQARQTTLAISLHHGETVLLNVGFDKSISIWDNKCIPDILEAGRKTMARRIEEIDEVTRSFVV